MAAPNAGAVAAAVANAVTAQLAAQPPAPQVIYLWPGMAMFKP
jgi:hypothetical protein